LPNGPIALLPLYDNYSSIVWSTNSFQAQQLLSLNDEEFREHVVNAFNHQDQNVHPSLDGGIVKIVADGVGSVLSQVEQTVDILRGSKSEKPEIPRIDKAIGKRAVFPLRLLHATSYVQTRVALIGDAAHVVHPLAGQGLNLGFADAAELTNALITAIESGTDIGALSILKPYENSRMMHNTPIVFGLDFISNLFGSASPPFIWARNFGISVVDKISPLKKFFEEQALGTFLDVSRIGATESLKTFGEEEFRKAEPTEKKQEKHTSELTN